MASSSLGASLFWKQGAPHTKPVHLKWALDFLFCFADFPVLLGSEASTTYVITVTQCPLVDSLQIAVEGACVSSIISLLEFLGFDG